jgi:hypothetical protein
LKIKSLTTKTDRIIIACTFLISVFIFAFNLNTISKPSTVNIEVDGILFGQYDISVPKTILVNSEYGFNKVLIENDSVCVIESSCNEQYEIGKKISKSGQCIVCLPNKVIIRITGNNEVDGVTY